MQNIEHEKTLLAAERTFSAWIRTGLAGMAGGLAILRLIEFKTPIHQLLAHIIGEVLILWGGAIFIFAALDYRKLLIQLHVKKRYQTFTWTFLLIIVPLLIITSLLIAITIDLF
jgi:putative membrane protein